MIIESETLKPPELAFPPRSRTPSIACPPPTHPAIQYGAKSPATPPGYSHTTRPSESVIYTFTPQPFNAMTLSAPSVAGARHAYFINVSLNCFTPSSHITAVRKYGWDGEFVGDFEMGPNSSKNPSSVCLRGNEYAIEEHLTTSTRLFRNYWTWKTVGHERIDSLFWDDSSSGSLTCFSSKDRTNSTLLAKFTPRSHKRRHGREVEYTKLEVTPYGHDVFEDILMSVLIIERIRTNPAG